MNRRNLESTPILDYDSPAVSRLAESITPSDDSQIGFLRAAHAAISRRIPPRLHRQRTPTYFDDYQHESGHLRVNVSASLEGLARSRGLRGPRVPRAVGLWTILEQPLPARSRVHSRSCPAGVASIRDRR